MDLKTDGIIALVCIAIAAGGYFYKKHSLVSEAKKEATQAVVTQYKNQVDEQRKQVKAAEDKLISQKADSDKEKQNAIQKVANDYEHQLDSLRKRTSRPVQSGSNSVASSGSSCTGAQLYREDAEFLAGEAARAEQVRVERDYYYEQYERAYTALRVGTVNDGGQQGSVSDSKPIP